MSHSQDYHIRRSARAKRKRARIIVSADKVAVIVSLRISVKQVQHGVSLMLGL